MKIEILAVGSELLTPDFQDTNSLDLTRRLHDLGFSVSRKTIVGDHRQDLSRALLNALSFAELILVTGGLGPTGDDLTREAVADALGRRLVFREDILAGIEERFRLRGKTMPAPNRKQAFVVEGAEVLANSSGTAPGLWIEAGTKRLILLPGPPQEMRTVFQEHVRPRLAAQRQGFAARRILRTTGLTESEVEERLAGLYPESEDVRLTVLASPGGIDLHIVAFSGRDEAEASAKAAALTEELHSQLGTTVYAKTGEEMEAVVGALLRRSGQTVATAESCSGGLLAHRLTNVPGSSNFYRGGFVAYANEAKIRDLGVPAEQIDEYGAVSAPVAESMARGARIVTGADWALAVTGIAGPDGGTPGKPVGLVFVALSSAAGGCSLPHRFFGLREGIKFQSSQKALDLLRRRLAGVA